MAGGSIIDQIINGIVVPDNNQALNALSDIFGQQLIMGSGSSSMLAMLSATMQPIYLAILLLIVFYIGVGGFVHSAMDGEFLGRRWNSFGVPAMLMGCVIALSPVPTKSNITLGQYVFIKGLIFGSNLADFMLKQVFMNAAKTGSAANIVTVGGTLADEERLAQVHNRMKSALPSYACGQILNRSGYGTQATYYLMLNHVCGVPTATMSSNVPYFVLGDFNYVKSINKTISAANSISGMAFPTRGWMSSTNVTQLANIPENQKSLLSQEMGCYFSAFDNYLSYNNISNAARAQAKVPQGTNTFFGTPPSSPPIELKPVPVSVDASMLNISWTYALQQAYQCVISNPALVKITADQAPATPLDPWARGWAQAPRILMNLDEYAKKNQLSDLGLTARELPTVNVQDLSTNISDQLTKKNITLLLRDLQELTNNGVLDEVVTQVANITQTNMLTNVNGTAESTAIRATLGMIGGLKAANVTAQQYNRAAAKRTQIAAFMNSLAGKTASAPSYAIGGLTRLVAAGFKLIQSKVTAIRKASDAADQALRDLSNSFGGLGSVVTSVVGGAKILLAPDPMMVAYISFILAMFVAVQYVPQIMLLLVMLLWAARAAVWFFVIPIATVLIALPNTRVGHDIWKSCLSIIFMPIIALIFYLISLFISDALYTQVLTWMFEPYLEAANNGIGSFALTLFKDILFGELSFRVAVGLSLCVAVFFYMNYMILRGTDMVTRALGLSSSSSDLGNDLSDIRPHLARTGLRM